MQCSGERDAGNAILNTYSQFAKHQRGAACCGSLECLSESCSSKVIPVGPLYAEKQVKKLFSLYLELHWQPPFL